MSRQHGISRSRRETDPVPLAVYGILSGISMLCVLLIVLREYRMGVETFRFMLWNLFLAWLPLIASLAAVQAFRALGGAYRFAALAVLGIGWLLLYPNAPYLTTDFIHLIFRRYDPSSMILWYDLVVFFLFSWCGLLLGYVSMRHFHMLIGRLWNGAAGWLFVAAASFLGGFGIYLGRVIRLNSWDALFSPFRLIEGVLEGLNPDAFLFTILFGTLILILYGSLYALRRDPGSRA